MESHTEQAGRDTCTQKWEGVLLGDDTDKHKYLHFPNDIWNQGNRLGRGQDTGL